MLANIIIKNGFNNSTGWNLGKENKSIHLFDPFTSIPIIGTKNKDIKAIKKRILEYLNNWSVLIEEKVKMTQNPDLIDKWKKLQTSDHFYYMCTKWFSDGDVHKYFNPYDSPYDSFIAFMNILNDLNIRINTTLSKQKKEVVIDAH